MMNKIYQKPEVEILDVMSEEMIATSNPEDGFNMGGVPTIDDTSGNLSRELDLWED
jgi:hypothetical protein